MSESGQNSGLEAGIGTSKWPMTVKTQESFADEVPPIASITIEIVSWTPGGTRISLPAVPEGWSHSSLVDFLVAELEKYRDCLD